MGLMLFLCSIGLGATPTPTPTPLLPTPIPTPTPDISDMVARLKAAKTANPFRPFTIYYHNPDGSIIVPDSAHLCINPSGKFTWIFVFSGDDTVASIPVLQIYKLVLVNPYPFDNAL